MIDYGAVRRCHYISITDTYDPLSNRRAFYDASYALPPAMCECYVQNMPVHGLSQFRYMLRSGMMGWCTIMTDTSRWTPQQHDAARRLFAAYKSESPLIRHANLFHISDRPDGIRWDAMEYFDPNTGRGAIFAFRGTAKEPEHRFVLKGLRPNDTYANLRRRNQPSDGSHRPGSDVHRPNAEAARAREFRGHPPSKAVKSQGGAVTRRLDACPKPRPSRPCTKRRTPLPRRCAQAKRPFIG